MLQRETEKVPLGPEKPFSFLSFFLFFFFFATSGIHTNFSEHNEVPFHFSEYRILVDTLEP